MGESYEFPEPYEYLAEWFDEWVLGLRFPHWVPRPESRVKREAFGLLTGMFERIPIQIAIWQRKNGS